MESLTFWLGWWRFLVKVLSLTFVLSVITWSEADTDFDQVNARVQFNIQESPPTPPPGGAEEQQQVKLLQQYFRTYLHFQESF